jgi:hypothetical protein
MGAAAALVVASRETLAGVVSISAAPKIEALDAGAVAGQVKEPTLFIVGSREEARYVDGARSLYAKVGQPKDLEIIEGASRHGTGLLTDAKVGERVRKLIIDFCVAHRG